MRLLNSFADVWKQWWLAPQPLAPLALFRIVIGVAMLQCAWLSWMHAADYYGPHALVSQSTALAWQGGPQLNLFLLLPDDMIVVTAMHCVFILSAVSLSLGFLTRLSAILAYLCLVSFWARDPFVFHSAHALLRCFAFYLMFSPAGRMWSIDALVARKWRGIELSQLPRNGVSQRLMQLQLCFVYFDAFWSKMTGVDWLSGVAVYYALQLESFRVLPTLSFVDSPVWYRSMTYFTLIAELSMWLLVWFKPLRYLALCLGCVLHIALFFALNIPLFQLVTLSAYLLFIDPRDLRILPSRSVVLQRA